MSARPEVSVIVPAHNAASTLPPLIAGLHAQRPLPFEAEFLLVDNASTDDTAAVARRGGLRVVEESTPGASAARNAGARAAAADLLVFLDSDCAPAPGWLERLVAVMADPDVGGAGGRVIAAPPTTLLERYAESRGDITQEAGLEDPFCPWVLTASCCYRASVFERLGGFDLTLRSGEDVDFSRRMQRELGSKLVYAPDSIVEHRHRTSLRGLWRQWVRYGWGTVQLADRYPSARGEHPKGASPAAWAWARARRVARAAVLLPLGRATTLDLAAPFLDVLIRVAERVGRRQARRAASSSG